MGAFLALLSSALWGTGDFLGGTLSRRAHPITVIRASQGMAAVVMGAIVVVAGEAGRVGAIGWGVAASACGCIGLGAFYAALASGTMGVVAPIAATGVVIPVAVGLAGGDTPGAFQLAGIVVAVVGVVLASGPERDAIDVRRSRRPLVLAGVASVGFGGALALLAQGAEVSVAMTLFSMRTTSAVGCTVVLLTWLRTAARPQRRDLPVLATIATTDGAANGAYAVATTLGAVSVSAVLASLYPAVTVLLAWRIHHERLQRVQVVGVVATFVGVALIAAG
jgi:drug/metabolite transporter (DMT)-like permease